MNRDEVKQNFLKTVKGHSLEVVHDDGVHRHLVFSRNKSMTYQFHLTTWPGHLCISGDMGTYVFSRLHDMFEFFRDGLPDLKINPGYWGEKLQAICKSGGYKEWSEDSFKEAVKDYHNIWFESHGTEEEATACWEEITESVLDYCDNEFEAYRAIDEFRCGTFHFQDFFEYSLTDYTYHYLWCLYAIVWGIQQYDNCKDTDTTIGDAVAFSITG